MCCQFSSEYETKNRQMIKLQMHHCTLKECIKDKEIKWIKEKEICEEIDQHNEESLMSSTSLIASEHQSLRQRRE